MGFFKKIGKAIKKGAKQISLKNVVKIGTPLLSMVPVVGGLAQNVVSGLSEAHEAKKAEKAAIEAGNQAQAEYYAQVAQQQAQLAGANVGQVAGSTLKTFSKGVTDELILQASDSTKQTLGTVASTVADYGINAWFKKHWSHLLIGAGVICGGLFFYKKMGSSSSKRGRR
nr:hypothetical protein [uncultured Flavobacterium sp.]